MNMVVAKGRAQDRMACLVLHTPLCSSSVFSGYTLHTHSTYLQTTKLHSGPITDK